MYDYGWLCMTIYNNLWLCWTMYDLVWLWMTIYGYVWLCLNMYEYVWLSMRERKRAILKTFHTSSIFLKQLKFFKQFKLFPTIQIFSNFSYSSTHLDFVFLCLPLYTFVFLCLLLFTFVQLTHLCFNFVLVSSTEVFKVCIYIWEKKKILPPLPPLIRKSTFSIVDFLISSTDPSPAFWTFSPFCYIF